MGQAAVIVLWLGIFGAVAWAGLWFVGHTDRTIVPVPVDDTFARPSVFFGHRGGASDDDVSLGSSWRTSSDPGAAFSLTWLPEKGEVVAMRRQRMATPPAPFFGLGPLGVPGRPQIAKNVTGMKSLGHASGDDVRSGSWRVLRTEPDGLDQLMARWGLDYDPPVGAVEWAEELAANAQASARAPGDAAPARDWIGMLPTIGAGLALLVLAGALVSDGGRRVGGSWSQRWPWVATGLVLAGVVVVFAVFGRYMVGWAHTWEVHRDHEHGRLRRDEDERPPDAPRAHRRDEE